MAPALNGTEKTGRTEGDLPSAVAELVEDCMYLKYGHCETLACYRKNGCAIARVVFEMETKHFFIGAQGLQVLDCCTAPEKSQK